MNCVLFGLEVEQKDFSEDRSYNYFETTPEAKYFISNAAYELIDNNNVSRDVIVHCRKEVLESVEQGSLPLIKVSRGESSDFDTQNYRVLYLDEIKDWTISHSVKPSKLIELHSQKKRTQGPFEKFKFTLFDMFKAGINDPDELKHWLIFLYNQSYITEDSGQFESYMNQGMDSVHFNVLDYYFRISIRGWGAIEESNKGTKSNKVFIAMSFGLENRNEIQDAISNACRACGYEATTVDREQYLGGITDKIISLIKSSKFVISDFTENKTGVYYEAGYAEGLGRKVIFTVNENHVDKLHFDTKHLVHLVWNSPEDLESKLTDKIKSLF
jgi:hypothetical protein